MFDKIGSDDDDKSSDDFGFKPLPKPDLKKKKEVPKK